MTARWFRVALVGSAGAFLVAQSFAPSLYQGMRWRSIGPFRSGRISAVAGIAGDPTTYYIGLPGGGVWKTTSGGTVWKPIFDDTHMDTIGSVAVAPSNASIVYVGTGDVSNVGQSLNQGNGVWKSTDAGAHWQHIGLDDTERIVSLVVDPKNPDVVLAAAYGREWAKSEARGIYRTTDGGRTWNKTLYKGDTLGAVNLVADPDNPQTVFAALIQHYSQPGGRGGAGGGGGFGGGGEAEPGAGIYKSADQGQTWTAMTGHGLPEGSLGRIGLAVAGHTGGQRVFAIMNGGLYRSDDGGANWKKSTQDNRVTGSNYFSQVYVASDTPDTVYVMQTSMYRSTDGGATFASFKGAPGGDDPHILWIDPANAKRMILGVDQGVTISIDGGYTWDTNWYNLASGQYYHIGTDNRFPYWVYGTEQDSGSAGTASRGAFGQITFMEWLPSVGAYEFGYIHADPLDPMILMASGQGNTVSLSDLRTHQIQNVSPPRSGGYRYANYPPHMFSPVDGHVFYLAAQSLLETRDHGQTWKAVSPDLTVAAGAGASTPAAPAAGGGTPTGQADAAAGGRGGRGAPAITAFSPSPAKLGVIWAGTSNGQVQMTADGSSWHNVTPDLPANTNIGQIEASPNNTDTAYFTFDRHTQNDFAPYIFRTRDAGKTWTRTIAGIPPNEIVRVVKEDPGRAGLLYAGSEHGAWVSFDAGDHWQSLQLNLPAVSVRDMEVHGDDLVIGTYGRAFWILDDVTPLRQMNAQVSSSDAFLFKPETAIRVRHHTGNDTPFPPEVTAAPNPPDGVILDYYLKSAGPVTLAVYDGAGKLVRELTSTTPPPEPEPALNVPNYWILRPTALPAGTGMNRTNWDLRYTTPPAFNHQYPISALYASTPAEPRGPLVAPGDYEVRLTAAGRTYRQPLKVVPDPRVKTTQQGYVDQRDLGLKISAAMTLTTDANKQVADVRASLQGMQGDAAGAAAAKAANFGGAAAGRGGRGGGGGGGGRGGGGATANFMALNGTFGGLMNTVEASDFPPTPAMHESWQDACKQLGEAVKQWEEFKKDDLAALKVTAPAAIAAVDCGK